MRRHTSQLFPMKLTQLRISTRLYLLSALLLCATLLTGVTGLVVNHLDFQGNSQLLRQTGLIERSVDTARDAQVQFKIQVQEWKNILLRGHRDQALLDRYRSAMVASGEAVQDRLTELETLLPSIGMDTSFTREVRRVIANLQEQYLQALQHYEVGQADSAAVVDDRVTGIDREPTEMMDRLVDEVLELSTQRRAAAIAQSTEDHARIRMLLFALLLSSLAAGVLAAWWFSRSITRPLAVAVDVAKQVATGNLGTAVAVEGRDETAQLLDSLNTMSTGLGELIIRIRRNAESVARATAEIAQGNIDLSSRTEQQAASLQETAASMEQLTSTVQQNADNARQAEQQATFSMGLSRQGGEAVAGAVATMEQISARSRQIADIVTVIDDIAFQTNILALNAAVEAARAGEQGRGFAIVAGEVRSLAQRSAQAAREIKTLIEDSVKTVADGAAQVSQAGSTSGEAVSAAQSVAGLMAEIAAATHEQALGIDQINRAVMQMDQVTQHNYALVQQAATATGSLENQSRLLYEAVSVFRVAGDNQEPRHASERGRHVALAAEKR